MGTRKVTPEFDYSGIGVEEIKTEFEALKEQAEEESESKGLFLVRPANKWIEAAKCRPIPKMLFAEF